MIEAINFLSRSQAEIMQPEKGDVLISISEPGFSLPNLKAGWGRVLSLQFWDLTEPLLKEGKIYPVITQEQAMQIADFIRLWHASDEKVRFIVHCMAGVSRSAAVALSAYDFTRAVFARRELACNANALVLKLVNTELGLKGYDIPLEVVDVMLGDMWSDKDA